MEIQEKTQLQLLQDLIEVVNHHKELLDKLHKKFPRLENNGKAVALHKKGVQAFLNGLLDELSLFGDGLGEPDTENEYNTYWRTALSKWSSMNEHRAVLLWRELNRRLCRMCRHMLQLSAPLPATLKKVLNKHVELFSNKITKQVTDNGRRTIS